MEDMIYYKEVHRDRRPAGTSVEAPVQWPDERNPMADSDVFSCSKSPMDGAALPFLPHELGTASPVKELYIPDPA
jgi:hypothetical protein